MKLRLRFSPFLIVLMVTIACGTTASNQEGTKIAQDLATMQALATTIAEKQETQEPTAVNTTSPTSLPTVPPPTLIDTTAIPQPTATLVPPTNTPVQPTSTPLPTATLPSDTPPGTVLETGGTWRTGGFCASLDRIKFEYGDLANLFFTFRNESGKTLFFYFNPKEHVTMQDDLGRFFSWKTPYDNDIILENGRSSSAHIFKGGDFSGASYFIITLDIPDLIYAQWRYN